MALIEPLKKIAEEQLDLLRVALYVASEGSAKFEGEVLTCSLTEPKRRTSTLLAMAAGQSINTILRMSELRGIAVRDVYPITRSAVETFINAAFLLSEEDSVAERAIRYVSYAGWKHTNRVVGSGEFALTISSDPDPEGTVANLFPEFSGSGKGSWTSFDTGSRIRRVGELAGCKAGSRLLAAYALIYNISSEIIHGSTYGVSYFYGTHRPPSPTLEEFLKHTERQLEDNLVAALHAVAGYLAAFFEVQGMQKLSAVEQRVFDDLLSLSGTEQAGAPPSTVQATPGIKKGKRNAQPINPPDATR